MPRTLADDFTLDLKGPSSTRGLVKRLVDGTLRPDEREDVATVERLLALEEDGKDTKAICQALGWTAEKLTRYTRTKKYRVLRKSIVERVAADDETEAYQRRQLSRRRFDANDQKALLYFDQALRQHPQDVKKKVGDVEVVVAKKGDFVDMDRAERTSLLVAKAQGWTEPLAVSTKPRQLPPGVIQAQMQGMAAADRKETVVRVTVGDTTVEIGSRSETATMEGRA